MSEKGGAMTKDNQGGEAELLNCPFCGGRTEVTEQVKLHVDEADVFLIHCLLCGATMNHGFPTEEDAVEAWNRRTTSEIEGYIYRWWKDCEDQGSYSET